MTQQINKLLFVSDAPHFGGAERYIASMASTARQRGIAPAVCWIEPADSSPEVFAKVRSQGIPVITVPATEVSTLPAFCRRVNRALRDRRPDAVIVNACGRSRFWSTTWLARLHGIPAAWVHHMVDQQDYRRLSPSRLGGRIEGLHVWRIRQALRHRLAATAATTVIALNEQDREQIAREQGLRPSQIAVVSNGIDARQYRFDADARQRARAVWMKLSGYTQTAEPFIIGTASRLIGDKGIEELIEATASLRTQNLPVLTVIAGEGPQRVELQRLAERSGVAECVLFLGFVSDMPLFYSGLDTFVLASRTESFGLVLAEALSCERPVVATPTPGARTQIKHGVSGWLCSNFTSKELAHALRTLQEQPALRDRLGREGRQHVVNSLGIDSALERTLQLLQPAALASRQHSVQPPVEAALATGGAA